MIEVRRRTDPHKYWLRRNHPMLFRYFNPRRWSGRVRGYILRDTLHRELIHKRPLVARCRWRVKTMIPCMELRTPIKE